MKDLNEIREIVDVQVVLNALKIIYSNFGDPLRDRDPNLVDGIELLQKYCMSKSAMKDISNLKSL